MRDRSSGLLGVLLLNKTGRCSQSMQNFLKLTRIDKLKSCVDPMYEMLDIVPSIVS